MGVMTFFFNEKQTIQIVKFYKMKIQIKMHVNQKVVYSVQVDVKCVKMLARYYSLTINKKLI